MSATQTCRNRVDARFRGPQTVTRQKMGGKERRKKSGDTPLGVARRGRLEDCLVDQAHLFHEGVLERVVAQHLLQPAGLLSAALRADGARPEIEVQAVVGGHFFFLVFLKD